MPSYRCYLLDGVGRASDIKTFDASDDNSATALSFAWFIAKPTSYERLEVWRGFDLIQAMHKQIAPRSRRVEFCLDSV